MSELLNALEPEGFESEGWSIKDDTAADWAIRAIKETEEDVDRQILVVDQELERLKELRETLEGKKESGTSYLRGKLMEYFETVKTKETKTQKSYALPSGKLVRKFGTIEYKKDEAALVDWLKENRPELVKTKESADWSAFKAEIKALDDGTIVHSTGEILGFISAELKPDKFEVK